MAQVEIPDGQVICTAPTIAEPELQALAFIVDMLTRNVPDDFAKRRVIEYLDARFPLIVKA